MTTEQGNLKPCPFCGGGVKLEEVKMSSGTWYGIKCRNNRNLGGDCAMEQVPSRTPEAAISRWNMRKPEEALHAQLAQCEAMAMMVAEREWAEHVGTGPVSSKVEVAFTQLHNELQEAQGKLAEMTQYRDSAANHMVRIREEATAFEKERDKLKGENMRLHRDLGRAGRNLYEAVQALFKDAERYRFIREQEWYRDAHGDWFGRSDPSADQDAQIDADMVEKAKQG